MTRRLAVIPARGGSKRIPNKNVKNFCGQPMIAYILNTARESGLFHTIHVSTDSIAIKECVEKLGYRVDFLRPKSLADDHTPIMPVLKYVASNYKEEGGKQFDEVWLLMACSPLITSNDLLGASKIFDSSKKLSPLLAITEYSAPIEWAFTLEENNVLVPVQKGMFAVRSQDIRKKYFDAGAFAVFPSSIVLGSTGAGSDNGFVGYVLPKGHGIDIDDESDWRLAEALYRINSR